MMTLVCYVSPMGDTLTIRLGEPLAEALEQEAGRTGLSKGEIIRQALETRLRQGGALRVMGRHFGSMAGPADLSANRAYRRTWKRNRA